MNKVFKVLLVAVCLLAVLAVLGITVTIGWKPFFGPTSRALTNRRFEATPDRLTRGKYLVESTLGCLDCHSDHDWKSGDMQPLSGRAGAGCADR